ncbi:hypothetical protein EC991_008508 [Linnemannia zychae]|nr:hypothetical protein EC991_008508 [Linnemannia zychae]
MSHPPHHHHQQQHRYESRNNNNNGPNLSLPYSDGGSLNIDSITDYYTSTTTPQQLHQHQGPIPSFSSSSHSPYATASSSSNLATNPSQLKRPPSPYIPANTTDRPKYPWNLPSAASSVISTPDLSGSTAYNSSISDRRRLINSWSSRPQSSVMDPNDQHHQHQFTAIELHNQQFSSGNNGNTTTNSHSRSPSDSNNELASLSPTTANKRPASVYSQSGSRTRTTKKKQGFWATIKPKKFSFRPDGVKRPKKADSVGNKKAKFSNERTMVHWIKAAMLMGSLAMTLLSFGENNITPYIGVALLVICLMMLIYSTTIFQVRMEWLNMRRRDVIYYDRLAPSILTFFVFVTFGFNAIVIYVGDFKTNKEFLKPY